MVTWLLWGTAHQRIDRLQFLSVSNSKPRFNLVFWLLNLVLFFSKLRQSSWHWASTGWRRWPCRRLGSTAALSAGLELGFCEKSNITSKPICFYKRSLFIFIHFFIFIPTLASFVGFVAFVVCQMCKSWGEWCVDRVHSLPSQGWRYRTTTWWYLNWGPSTWYSWYFRLTLSFEDPVADANDWMICLQCDCRTGFFEKTRQTPHCNMWKFDLTFAVWQCLTSF